MGGLGGHSNFGRWWLNGLADGYHARQVCRNFGFGNIFDHWGKGKLQNDDTYARGQRHNNDKRCFDFSDIKIL